MVKAETQAVRGGPSWRGQVVGMMLGILGGENGIVSTVTIVSKLDDNLPLFRGRISTNWTRG